MCLKPPKLGRRLDHDMAQSRGADYGELLLEAKEVDNSAIGLMPRGTAARTPALLAGGRWLRRRRTDTRLSQNSARSAKRSRTERSVLDVPSGSKVNGLGAGPQPIPRLKRLKRGASRKPLMAANALQNSPPLSPS